MFIHFSVCFRPQTKKTKCTHICKVANDVLSESKMNNFNENQMNILDLPDEILFVIFEKLNMIDVFYSFIQVNRRFNRLVFDCCFLRDVNLATIKDNSSLRDQTSSTNPKALSRICEKILPRIYDQTYKLTVDEYSAKYMFLASNYSKLYSLSLMNFQIEIFHQYLTDNLILCDILTNQITHLSIDIKKTTERSYEIGSEIFAKILSLCQNLIVLNFCDMFSTENFVLSLNYFSWNRSISSALIKLRINLSTLADCHHLLDGSLVCLSTLIINVTSIYTSMNEYRISTKKLPKLKYFSLTSLTRVLQYDELVVPLLRRMINVEELKLNLSVDRVDLPYIDGIELYDQFLVYMTQLKNFTFNMKTEISFETIQFQLQSTEEIQRSFIGRGYPPVASYINSNPFSRDGACYIYSLPYDFEYFTVDNSFPGGVFHKVRSLLIQDRAPFKDTMFELVSQGFPFLQILRVCNIWPPEDFEHPLTLITFPYLQFLDVKNVHFYYAARFLLKRWTHLPRLSNLSIDYPIFMLIIKHFPGSPTNFNFDKLKSLDVGESFVRPRNFHQYFPLL